MKPDGRLPKSVVGWFDALIALPAVVGAFFLLRYSGLSDVQLSVVLVLVLAVVMGSIELMRAPWWGTAPSADSWSQISERAVVKLLGFFAALAVIAFLYWLFPEYHRDYYDRFFLAARIVVPWLPLICVPYFFFVEWRLPFEEGGAWHAGLAALGKWGQVDWFVFSQYALSWLVKGFFLPIMFGDIVNNIALHRAVTWNFADVGFLAAYNVLFSACIHLELVFVSAGYLFTCRLFDTQVRDVERTLFGWMIALMSYSPFLSLFYVRYLDYSVSGAGWSAMLASYPMLIAVWGSVILILLALHMWCDACFGLRFSNLTNRGIITNGPYRFSKHPAYVIKSIRWWMVSVPFFAVSFSEGIRLSILLLLVNLVYTLRSYAEERMLSRDPTYVQYASWIDRHGLLRFLGKRFAIFSYEWRLARWRRQGFVKP
jgi:isoprenylcysteine carboxyl methyltransferase (ICMT) family protein YpbQ